MVPVATGASASPPPTRMVDGDLLQQFLQLPEPQQQVPPGSRRAACRSGMRVLRPWVI